MDDKIVALRHNALARGKNAIHIMTWVQTNTAYRSNHDKGAVRAICDVYLPHRVKYNDKREMWVVFIIGEATCTRTTAMYVANVYIFIV